jgi:putative adenylate-forming enzyme
MKRVLSSIFNGLHGLETRSFLLFFIFCRYRFRHFTETEISLYQAIRVRAQTRYAAKHSRFFRNLYCGLDLENAANLPTVNKKIMMDNLTDYNTVGLTRKEIIDFCLEVEKSRDFTRRLKGLNVGMSSGTSGNKGVEILTRREEMYMKAALFARFHFPGKEKLNLAFILRVSSPAFNLNILGHRMTYISQLGSTEEVSDQLQRLQPNVISAPPSMLKIIAREVEAGRLIISPKRVVSYAEILYPDVKKYLSDVLHCPVHEIYKCTEAPMAITCRFGSLHINEDLVLVETLNSDGSETTPGQPCHRLIVTDLHKKSQPIIRYELNDIITISPEKCQCGSNFRVIQSIQGRADDLFWARTTDGDRWQPVFPDYISRAIISSSEEIDEYQATQDSPEHVAIRIKLKEDADPTKFHRGAVADSVKDVFRKYKCHLPEVSVEFGSPESSKNSGKLIRIRRNFAFDG